MKAPYPTPITPNVIKGALFIEFSFSTVTLVPLFLVGLSEFTRVVERDWMIGTMEARVGMRRPMRMAWRMAFGEGK
jgi:hypothetical protein